MPSFDIECDRPAGLVPGTSAHGMLPGAFEIDETSADISLEPTCRQRSHVTLPAHDRARFCQEDC